jgi:hypothetical protein
VRKSLIIIDAVFKNICSVEDISPELIKHFDDTFDIKDFEKITREKNIKIKAGTEKLLMSQLCQIYCALVNMIVKSKMVEKGNKKKKKKKKSKTKNKKGGVLLQDEQGYELEDRQRSELGKMMNYVKRNLIQISLILFNMYIIYLSYTELKRLLDTGITFDSQQFESSGLTVYNENNNLVATLNANMVELERVSILDLILHYKEVVPKVQTALIQEYNDRIEEYTTKIRGEAIERSKNLRMDLHENMQEGVGIDTEGNVDHLRFIYTTLFPSSVVKRVTDQTLKQGQRQIRDLMTDIERDLLDMRTVAFDRSNDLVDKYFYNVSMLTDLLSYSGMFFVALMIRFIVSHRRSNTQYEEQYSPRSNPPLFLTDARGSKKLKSKKGKKSKKKGKKLRK